MNNTPNTFNTFNTFGNYFWTCPQCPRINNHGDDKCMGCRCFKSKSKEYQAKNRDWKCINSECNEINFESRNKCRKCGLEKCQFPPLIPIKDKDCLR